MVLLTSFMFLGFISGVGEQSFCCERLETPQGGPGAWCMDAPQEECYNGNSCGLSGNEKCKVIPTSCDATSYCRLGTCINTVEGTCMPNVAQQTCNIEGGVWQEASPEDLPQCHLGCCLIGDEAAFVTQTRCNQLSSLYGLDVSYRSDITEELLCIASATSEDMGACVFERDFERTCLMTTKNQCTELQASSVPTNIFENYFGNNDEINGIDSTTVKFHEGFLCSATELGTNCGPRGGTTCVDGEDEVYFLDTCGNLANVYDSSKLNDNRYWTYITEADCGVGEDSPSCGDCGYFEGSVCGVYERNEGMTRPDYGNYVCKSLDCGWYDKDKDGRQDSDEYFEHGERFCVSNADERVTDENLPGTRYFMMECRDGEFIEQPCAEFRQEICIEEEIVDGYSNAGCVVNKWQDCTNQTSKADCLEENERDCEWLEGHTLLNSEGESYALDENDKPGFCVPKYTPGFDFYANEGNGDLACGIASATCVAGYEIGILRDRSVLGGEEDYSQRIKYCTSNCYCIPGYKRGMAKNKYEKGSHPFYSYEDWVASVLEVCSALGDCGNKNNYLNLPGEERDDVITSEFTKNAGM